MNNNKNHSLNNMSQYDFKQLSHFDFEDLSRDLLQEELNIFFESFSYGPDQGIDFRHSISKSNNSIIIQCKHYAHSTVSKLISDLKKERTKLETLKPDRYILTISLNLSVSKKSEVLKIFSPFIKNISDIFCKDDLNNLLSRHPTVEKNHHKLWLSSSNMIHNFLNKDAIDRSDFSLDQIFQKQKLFVSSNELPRAKKILDKNNILIITGQPGIGKSTLASVLICQHLRDHFDPIIINSSLSEGRKLFNQNQKQLFYFDDFLGATFLGDQTSFLYKNEDRDIINFIKMIQRSKSSKLILTSRDHILNQANSKSERFKQDFPDHQKIVLELNSYSKLQKAKILYNHIYFSDLPRPYKKALLKNDFYLTIINHKNYNPRIIEWLTSFSRLRGVPPKQFQSFIINLLHDPFEVWENAYYEQISKSAQTLLLVIYSFRWHDCDISYAEGAFQKLNQMRGKKYNFTHDSNSFKAALKELSGAFIEVTGNLLSYINPSVRDFMNQVLSSNVNDVIDIINSSEHFRQIEELLITRYKKNSSLASRGSIIAPKVLQIAKKKSKRIRYMSNTLTRINKILLISENSECTYMLNAGVQLLKNFISSPTSHTIEDLISPLKRIEEASWEPLKDIIKLEEYKNLRELLVDPEIHDLDAKNLCNASVYLRNSKSPHDKLMPKLCSKIDRYIRDDLEIETQEFIYNGDYEELISYHSSLYELDVYVGGDFEPHLDRVMDRISEKELEWSEEEEDVSVSERTPKEINIRETDTNSEIIQMFKTNLL